MFSWDSSDWELVSDNYRIQDPDIAYIPELSRYAITANKMDKDGNPGGNFPGVKGGGIRVIGVFYSTAKENKEGVVPPESPY